ncbi:MAG: nucleotidyltransferase substrate binding protein [Candidatus Sungbacteria bacterium]|nr:nucleotidyltransferase substrate binding protein [Candidatus Sungbacteria bacterium]
MLQSKYEAIRNEYQEAVIGLEEVLKKPKDEFMRDSAIKRFELAFDLAWKTIKAFLEDKGLSCTSPVSCFKEAYRQGLVEYDDAWIKELVETRNKTVHTYDEDLAEEVYAALPNILNSLQKLLHFLRDE